MTTVGAPSTDQSVPRSALPDQTVSGFFLRLMRAVRTWWPTKTAEELAAILGCDQRSAARYLAGDRTPSADAVFTLIASRHGAQLIGLIASEMTPERRADFWKEMAKSARRAELLEERARLDRELSQVSG